MLKSTNFYLCSCTCQPKLFDANQDMGHSPTLIQQTLFTGAVCPSNVKIQVPNRVYITISTVHMQARTEKVHRNKPWVNSDGLLDSPSELSLTPYVKQEEKLPLHQRSLGAIFCTPFWILITLGGCLTRLMAPDCAKPHPCFIRMYYSFLDRMLEHSLTVYQPHEDSKVQRGKARVTCLAQEYWYNSNTCPGLKPAPYVPKSIGLKSSAT